MNSNIILEDAIEQNNYDAVSAYVNESITQLKNLQESMNLEALEKEIEQKKSSFAFLVKKKLMEKNAGFSFGRYIGYVDAVYDQLAEQYKEKEFRDTLESYAISDIPHVNDILLTIKRQEGIRHGQLAEKVGIEKSTLSGIMDRLFEKGVIRFSRPGKYKYYYLTEFGNKYYKNNKQLIESEVNIDALTEQLLIALSKEDDVNEKMLQIIATLCKGENTFNGYKSKTRGKVNPSRLFAGLPSIKQLYVLFSDNLVHTVNGGLVFGFDPEQQIIQLLDEKNNNYTEIFQLPTMDLVEL